MRSLSIDLRSKFSVTAAVTFSASKRKLGEMSPPGVVGWWPDLGLARRERSPGGGSEQYGFCKHDASFKGTRATPSGTSRVSIYTRGIGHIERKSWCNLSWAPLVCSVLHTDESAQRLGCKPAEIHEDKRVIRQTDWCCWSWFSPFFPDMLSSSEFEKQRRPAVDYCRALRLMSVASLLRSIKWVGSGAQAEKKS